MTIAQISFEKYRNDVWFHRATSVMVDVLRTKQMSPFDLQQCVELAIIIHEEEALHGREETQGVAGGRAPERGEPLDSEAWHTGDGT
jgi:hypothetical protein